MSERRAEQADPTSGGGRGDEGLRIGPSLLGRADVERLLRGFVILVIAASTLAGSAGIYAGDSKAVGAASVAFVVALVLYGLVRARRFGLGAALWTWTLLGISVFVTVTGRGTRDVGMNVFPVVILSAGLLLPRRSALLMMIVTVLTGGMIGVAELLGWLHHAYAIDTRVDQVADVFILLGAVAALVTLLSATLYRSLETTFATERSYAQIFDATHDAILVASPRDRVIVNVNRSAVRMFNRTREELVGTKLETLLGDQDENGRALVEHVGAAAAAEARRFEVGLERADGSRLALEVSMQEATVGDRAHILTVARDIGERRAIEKTLMEGEKLRVVGQLARGVAHDFNNQLTGILGSAALLEGQLLAPSSSSSPASSTARGHLDVIERSARRSAELVSQLLAFARTGTQRTDAVDCSRLLDEVEQLLRRSIDKRIAIRVRKASEPVNTFGDATLLQNALLNLALNARDAMPSGGELVLSSRQVMIDEDGRRGLPGDLPSGRYASLVVSDTGTGIDEETLAHIFEPFFTTKETGNGMGLAAVYGTVRSHGGATRVDSELGRGTRFELLLPLADPVEVVERARSPLGPVERRTASLSGLRILVGDDERLVRETTVLLLERFGCVVEAVPSGDDALRVYRDGARRYDLILLDHDMPGLSGTDTAERLRQLDADIPILIVSGYGDEVVPARGDVIQGLLSKPFSEEQLAQAVIAAIETRRRARAAVH